MSKDGDIFVKDPEIARGIASKAGWHFGANPELRSGVIGIISWEKDGVELRVDVLRSVNGLSDADLVETETLTLKDGIAYCVPAPDIMLKAKLANLDKIPQVKRQDERHVRIMIPCCRHYLADTVGDVRLGRLSEREAVERFMSTHRVTTSPAARRLDQLCNLKVASAIPNRETLKELTAFPKLRAFYDHQIEKISSRIRPSP